MTQIIKLHLRRDLLDTPRKAVTVPFRKTQTTHFFWMWLCGGKHFGTTTDVKEAIIQEKSQHKEDCKLKD